MTIDQANDQLCQYVALSCPGCFAEIKGNGKIRLNGYFEVININTIMVIYEKYLGS